MEIKIRRTNKNNPLPKANNVGEWYDLYVAKSYSLAPGESALIDLGVNIEVPAGYEAILAARSSTFKKYGLLQTNGIGVIDNAYSGNDDLWMMPVLATTQIDIEEGTRLCQFRIQRQQPEVEIIEVEDMSTSSRGGFGSSGK